ncbi:hypothetical protein [Massilia forsythiae]|uniref:hypothetical protein n=1 Tax=Massilia forsythiae TaxID=2728020 RepID=UPI00351CD8D2
MEILKRQLSFSSSKIEEAALGVNRDMVRVILRAMKAEGLIELNGKGRGAKWQRKRPSPSAGPPWPLARHMPI